MVVDTPTVLALLVALVVLFLVFQIKTLLVRKSRLIAEVKRKKQLLLNKPIENRIAEIGQQISELTSSIEVAQIHQKKLQSALRKSQDDLRFINAGIAMPTFGIHDSEALKEKVRNCREEQLQMVISGAATRAISNWEFFGSFKDGAQMVSDYRSLLLEAFNAEFESIRSKMRVATYEIAREKLVKLKDQLTNLGEAASVRISESYLRLKINELKVWHDELVRRDFQKAEQQKQKELLRSQAKDDRSDVDDLDEELAVQESELRKAQMKAASLAGAERVRLELLIDSIKREKELLEQKMKRSISQAQITRAGYIYVISNHGSFGEGIVKIGMTRRLEPMDRVNELGDASVPYRFDVHALVFVNDAPLVESELHRIFSQQRVNTENLRKEFFRVSPQEVKSALEGMLITCDWYFDVEAREFRESELLRAAQANTNKKVRISDSLPTSI